MSTDDFTPNTLPDISWENEKRLASLEALYGYVMEQSRQAREWYRLKKKPKRILGKFYRLGSLLLASFGGAIPVLYKINESWIDPVFGSLCLGAAGLLVVMDRFGDHTSGWVRYLRTEQTISGMEEKFRFHWHRVLLNAQDENLSSEKCHELLSALEEYCVSVIEVVKEETDEWARTFQAVLNEIEPSRKPMKN